MKQGSGRGAAKAAKWIAGLGTALSVLVQLVNIARAEYRVRTEELRHPGPESPVEQWIQIDVQAGMGVCALPVEFRHPADCVRIGHAIESETARGLGRRVALQPHDQVKVGLGSDGKVAGLELLRLARPCVSVRVTRTKMSLHGASRFVASPFEKHACPSGKP